MKKHVAILLTVIVVSTATALLAEELRVIGRVTQVESSSLTVKTKEGRDISIATDKKTTYLRDQKKIDVSEVKAGQSVVVDGQGDNVDHLLASEVRLVRGSAKGK